MPDTKPLNPIPEEGSSDPRSVRVTEPLISDQYSQGTAADTEVLEELQWDPVDFDPETPLYDTARLAVLAVRERKGDSTYTGSIDPLGDPAGQEKALDILKKLWSALWKAIQDIPQLNDTEKNTLFKKIVMHDYEKEKSLSFTIYNNESDKPTNAVAINNLIKEIVKAIESIYQFTKPFIQIRWQIIPSGVRFQISISNSAKTES